MKKIFFLLLASMVFSADYNEGDTVDTADQNVEFSMCSGYNPDGDNQNIFKLADLNGAVNGGNYHVIWIDMAATW